MTADLQLAQRRHRVATERRRDDASWTARAASRRDRPDHLDPAGAARRRDPDHPVEPGSPGDASTCSCRSRPTKRCSRARPGCRSSTSTTARSARTLDHPARRRSPTRWLRRPLVLAGLAVGVGFKAGLFNIGGTGPVPARRLRRGLVGAARGAAAGADRGPGRDPGGCPRRRAVRVHPGRPQGVHRRPRGRRHDHAQLVAAFAIIGLVNGPLQDHRVHRSPGPAMSATPRCRSSSDATATSASSSRSRSCRSSAGPDLPDDARLRDPHRRRQPERGALRGHAARAG